MADSPLLKTLRHTLHTPLNAIIGYSELLLEDARDQDARRQLQHLREAGRQLLARLNDALAPEKVDAGHVTPENVGTILRAELLDAVGALILNADRLLNAARTQNTSGDIADLEKIRAAAQDFWALIDAEPNSRADTRAEAQSTAPTPFQAVTSLDDPARVLVVDDNATNRDILARYLTREGHAAAFAEHGYHALERLRAERFDLVLLDILMPEMDGYETLKRIKADANWRDIPVIMISALDEMDSVVRCVEMGAEDYLPKPFNPVLLRARISAGLEKRRLRDKEKMYLRGLERDLEIGRQIQQSFLPAKLPQAKGWEIAAHFQPARQVAGDFYDAFLLADATRLGIVIADVCDKGVGAALFMALFRSLLRASAERFYSRSPRRRAWLKPKAGVNRALKNAVVFTNDYIARTHSDANMFATLFFGVLDPKTGALEYVNAGHNPPLIFRAGSVHAALARTGAAIGLKEGASLRVQSTRLARGDLLFAYTDGAPDAPNARGEAFTDERLIELALADHASASEMLEEISAQLRTHMEGAEPFDDVTMVAVRRK